MTTDQISPETLARLKAVIPSLQTPSPVSTPVAPQADNLGAPIQNASDQNPAPTSAYDPNQPWSQNNFAGMPPADAAQAAAQAGTPTNEPAHSPDELSPEEANSVATLSPGTQIPPNIDPNVAKQMGEHDAVIDKSFAALPITSQGAIATLDKARAQLDAENVTKAGLISGVINGAQDKIVANEQEAQAKQALIEQKSNDLIDSITKASDNLSKVDPGRFWGNLSTGGKIMAAISIGLSGIGGGPNRAAESISQAVDNDIAAQKDNIATQKDAINAKRGALTDLHNQFGDINTATNAFKAAAYKRVEYQLDQIGAQYSGQDAQQKLAELKTQIQQKQTDNDAKSKDDAVTSTVLDVNHPDLPAAYSNTPSLGEKVDLHKQGISYLDAYGAGKADQLKALEKSEIVANQVKPIFDEIQAIRKRSGVPLPASPDGQRLKALGSLLVEQLKNSDTQYGKGVGAYKTLTNVLNPEDLVGSFSAHAGVNAATAGGPNDPIGKTLNTFKDIFNKDVYEKYKGLDTLSPRGRNKALKFATDSDLLSKVGARAHE